MLTDVIYVSENEVILRFDCRGDFRVTSDDGTALTLANQLMAPAGFRSYGEWIDNPDKFEADTEVIELPELMKEVA